MEFVGAVLAAGGLDCGGMASGACQGPFVAVGLRCPVGWQTALQSNPRPFPGRWLFPSLFSIPYNAVALKLGFFAVVGGGPDGSYFPFCSWQFWQQQSWFMCRGVKAWPHQRQRRSASPSMVGISLFRLDRFLGNARIRWRRRGRFRLL